MKKNKYNKRKPNFDSTQGDNPPHSEELFDSEWEYEFPRYPERKNIDLPTENDDAEFNFHFEEVCCKEEDKPPKKKRRQLSATASTAIMALAFIAAFGILCSSLIFSQSNTSPQVSDTSASTESIPDSPDTRTVYIKEFSSADGALTPQEIYSYNSPSVVSISARGESTEGIGSGFIISSSGYIATAQHVVAGMSEISVILGDGEKYKAELVGADELTDLALLKISADGLRALEFGSSSELLIGDELVAIGTPASLEFSGTMSRGDVSYTDRKIYIYDEQSGALRKKMTLIQTTAALNPGNSGGPVFDSYGKVVGIVTMRLGSDFEGISFILPSDGAAPILFDMMNGIEISNERRSLIATKAARIGITCESYLDKNSVGVIIRDFTSPDCDAAKKLRLGDVIVSVGSETVTSAAELGERIKKYDPGDSIEITVLRADQLLTFIIILGA